MILIDDYLKIYKKCTEIIEMKTESGLTGLQTLQDKYPKKEAPTWFNLKLRNFIIKQTA